MNELRTWVAIRLATDIDTCCALLRGEAVDPARLDQKELAFMRHYNFVRLDTAAIGFFEPQLRRTMQAIAA